MDDDDVRRALWRAVMTDEKEHRDLIGPAVEIVLRRRRRVRAYGAASSGLVIAAGATAAIWLTGSSTEAHPEPTASTTPTTSSVTPTEQTEWDKEHDVFYRLPGLLNPLLPHGLTIAKSTAQPANTEFRLIGPSGNNDFSLTAAPKDQRNRALEMAGCVVGGVCTNRPVPGGTLYIQTKNFTADYGGASGYAPGTGKQVLSIDAEYEFVPAAADGYAVDLNLAAAVSHEQYAAKAPKDWGDQNWPPQPQPDSTFNSSGALLSPDDFMTLISQSGFRSVTALLDPSSPVDRSTLDRHKAADATIAAAVKPILPAGLTLTISDQDGHPQGGQLTLTGPTGSNKFSWRTSPQSKTWRHGYACTGHTRKDCTWKEVPGGEIEVTHSGTPLQNAGDTSPYAPGQTGTPVTAGDLYTFQPDDPNGTIIELSTGEQIRDIPWSATRPTTGPYADSSRPWPPPARNGEPFNAAGPLLTVDQFAAMVQTPGIADVVRTVNAALDPLGFDGLEVFS